jgi:signal transduction histidine kinase
VSVEEQERVTVLREKRILLSSTRDQIQNILDAFPFYVTLVDPQHNIVAANQRIIQDYNLDTEQPAGVSCPIAIHGCHFPIPECPLTEACKKGKAVEKEIFDARNARWLRTDVYPTLLVTDDGEPIYVHFIRDITDAKNTEEKLSQSLEHHRALCDLLQKFQYCQTSTQILEAAIQEAISLSWLGVAATAVGFLAQNEYLVLTVKHNVPHGQLARCERVVFGDCLCGKAAQTGEIIICSSTSSTHNFEYEGMVEHNHAVLPISNEGQVLGILTLYLRPGNDLNPAQLDFLKAAANATGAALASQLAREEVKRVREKSMAQMISYQEDERKRIARELHDQVCQSLSALLLEMQGHSITDESLREMQRGCETRIRGLIDEVRGMAVQLRPAILDDYGLEMALARYVEDLSSNTGLPIDYQCVRSAEQHGRLHAAVEVGLYRVALEALNNTIRHASATRASVVVIWQNSKFILLIEDDGCGFDYPAIRKDLDRCLGLIGMEERIALMGGTLRIESALHAGTTVRAEIPIHK